MNYCFSVLITKEDDWYVARRPELNLTSQVKDVESAGANLREAIETLSGNLGRSLNYQVLSSSQSR